ncbi:hypothetical protein FRC20_002290 [Serendipita sp. 405]|nr:hypothetical protein FRC20_002290 [Serendipita sp. 405]
MFPRDFGDSEWGHFNPTTLEIKLQIQEFVEVARTVPLPTRGPGPGTRPRSALENSREVIEPHQRRRVMTYSDQAGEKRRPRSPKGKVTKQRRNELDERMKDLISLINRCEDRTVRLRYLDQLTNFSGVLVRYDSPEATMAYGMNLKGADTNLYEQKMHCMSCISRSCLPPPWQAEDIPECIHSRVYYWLSYQRRIDLANQINQVTLCCTLCSPYPSILRLTQHISTLFHFLSEWEVTFPQGETWVSQRVDPLRLLDYYDGERRTLQADLAKLNSWRQLFLPNPPLRAQARPLLNRCVDYIMDNLDLNSLFNSTEETNESIPVVELDNDLRRMVIDLLLYEKEAERLGGEDAAIFQRKPWDEEFLDELYPGPYLGVKAVPFVLHTWLYCQTTRGR